MKKSFRVAARFYPNTLSISEPYFFIAENSQDRKQAFENITKLHKAFWEGRYNYPNRVNKVTYVIECEGGNDFGEVVEGTKVNLTQYFSTKLYDLQKKVWAENQCVQTAQLIEDWKQTIKEGKKKLTDTQANLLQILLEKHYGQAWHKAGLFYLSNKIKFEV